MYDALPEPSIKRMNSISKNAISLCTAVYLLVCHFPVWRDTSTPLIHASALQAMADQLANSTRGGLADSLSGSCSAIAWRALAGISGVLKIKEHYYLTQPLGLSCIYYLENKGIHLLVVLDKRLSYTPIF